jgi:eukaryotic-like serine/threonine-protein kinase
MGTVQSLGYLMGRIQCLTGKHPNELFDEDILALRWQHLCQVSLGLVKVLEKMVAQQPNERYRDGLMAMDVVEELLVSRQPQPPKPTQKSPIPPVQPAAQKVKVTTKVSIPSNNSGADSLGRRKLLKFLGFGGSGLIDTLLLAQFLPKDSTTTVTSSTSSKNNKEPDLSKISFASVRLDSTGKILERPEGSAMAFQEDLGNGIFLKMVKIPAGKFMMGSPANEEERSEDESPQHQVKVPEFYLGQTLVTQGQWQALMGSNPSNFKGNNNLPVDSVSWLNAMDFCEKLSQKTGHTYRLPSEAEWEYACRAGTTTPFAFGETITPAVVNYDGNYTYGKAAKGEYRQKTTVVGSFPANLFGLYDMHGNLWEWCLDEWSDNYQNAPNDGSAKGDLTSRDKKKMRVLRGGSWSYNPDYGRSANRFRDKSDLQGNIFGFRVVYAPASTL